MYKIWRREQNNGNQVQKEDILKVDILSVDILKVDIQRENEGVTGGKWTKMEKRNSLNFGKENSH